MFWWIPLEGMKITSMVNLDTSVRISKTWSVYNLFPTVTMVSSGATATNIPSESFQYFSMGVLVPHIFKPIITTITLSKRSTLMNLFYEVLKYILLTPSKKKNLCITTLVPTSPTITLLLIYILYLLEVMTSSWDTLTETKSFYTYIPRPTA